MSDASDAVSGIPELGELDSQDLKGDFTDVERQTLPQQASEPLTSRGETEKLARFFAQLPGPNEAKTHFFGFLTHIHQYGFFGVEDWPRLSLLYEQAESAYINSVPAWEYTREHSVMLSNIRAIFFSLIRGAIGTDKDIINARVSLNSMRIGRAFSEYSAPRKKRWLNF